MDETRIQINKKSGKIVVIYMAYADMNLEDVSLLMDEITINISTNKEKLTKEFGL